MLLISITAHVDEGLRDLEHPAGQGIMLIIWLNFVCADLYLPNFKMVGSMMVKASRVELLMF